MKKFILLILVTFIISGCTLIPKKSSPSEANNNTNTSVETNVNETRTSSVEVKNDAVDKLAETIDWKTYTNSQYKISIKYPADWRMDGDVQSVNNGQVVYLPFFTNTAIGSTKTENGQGSFYVRLFKTTETLDQFFMKSIEMTDQLKKDTIDSMKMTDVKGSYSVSDIISSKLNTTVTGRPAILQDIKYLNSPDGASVSREYVLKDGEYIYDFLLNTPSGSSSEAIVRIFDSFVRTFTVNPS